MKKILSLALLSAATAYQKQGGLRGLQEAAEPFPIFKCPVDRPGTQPICAGTFTCYYGEETCCDETFPLSICICIGGKLSCFDHSSCTNRICSTGTCPEEEPVRDLPCANRPPAETCAYRHKSCCGITYAQSLWQCFDEEWKNIMDMSVEQCPCGEDGALPTPTTDDDCELLTTDPYSAPTLADGEH